MMLCSRRLKGILEISAILILFVIEVLIKIRLYETDPQMPDFKCCF